MRVLMALLLFSCVACILSAVTGFRHSTQIHAPAQSSAAGTATDDCCRIFYAAISALAFYGIYRHYPVVWKLGWVFLIGGAVEFIVLAWLSLIHQPYGWVGAIAATLGGIGVTVYWVFGGGQSHIFFPMQTNSPNQSL